jgi:hypothetical protein
MFKSVGGQSQSAAIESGCWLSATGHQEGVIILEGGKFPFLAFLIITLLR